MGIQKRLGKFPDRMKCGMNHLSEINDRGSVSIPTSCHAIARDRTANDLAPPAAYAHESNSVTDEGMASGHVLKPKVWKESRYRTS